MQLLQEWEVKEGTIRFYVNNDKCNFVLEVEKPWDCTSLEMEYGTAFLLSGFLRTSIQNCLKVWESGNQVVLDLPMEL